MRVPGVWVVFETIIVQKTSNASYSSVCDLLMFNLLSSFRISVNYFFFSYAALMQNDKPPLQAKKW